MDIDNTVVNSIVSGDTPAEITQSIKDLLFAKASERIDDYRQVVATNVFDYDDEVESEEQPEEQEAE